MKSKPQNPEFMSIRENVQPHVQSILLYLHERIQKVLSEGVQL